MNSNLNAAQFGKHAAPTGKHARPSQGNPNYIGKHSPIPHAQGIPNTSHGSSAPRPQSAPTKSPNSQQAYASANGIAGSLPNNGPKIPQSTVGYNGATVRGKAPAKKKSLGDRIKEKVDFDKIKPYKSKHEGKNKQHIQAMKSSK